MKKSNPDYIFIYKNEEGLSNYKSVTGRALVQKSKRQTDSVLNIYNF